MSIVQQVNSLCTVGYMSVYVRGIGQIGPVRGTVIERFAKITAHLGNNLPCLRDIDHITTFKRYLNARRTLLKKLF